VDWPDIGATYDAVAADYAASFAGELAGKPADRALLDRLAAACRGEPVWDVGCGAAGHITRYLADRAALAAGMDLSPVSVAVASRLNPDLRFCVADMRALPAAAGSLAGIAALYSVIHLPRKQIGLALAEFRRVLRPGGVLLLAMHGGTGEVTTDDWFGKAVQVRATMVALPELTDAVASAGFTTVQGSERAPYPGEHQTQRLYVWAS
jgi:SAM-dependent methyltransferase